MNDDGELILYYGTAKPGDRNFADVVAIDDEIIGCSRGTSDMWIAVSATASAKTLSHGQVRCLAVGVSP